MTNESPQIIDDFNPKLKRQERGRYKGYPLYFKNKYKFSLIDDKHPQSLNKWVLDIKRRPNTLLVSNFNYRSKLYLAEIPLIGLDQMYLMSVPFFEMWVFIFSHAQMLLKFNEPIVLYPQNDHQKTKLPIEIYSFIYSYNYVGGYDPSAESKNVEQYSPLGGFWFTRRKYEGTHNLIDFHDWKDYEIKSYTKALNSIKEGKKTSRKSPTTLYEIEVSKINSALYLQKQFQYGNFQNAQDKKYETLFRNCGNIILRNIISSIHKPKTWINRFNPKIMLAYYSPARVYYFLKHYQILKSETDLLSFLNHPKK